MQIFWYSVRYWTKKKLTEYWPKTAVRINHRLKGARAWYIRRRVFFYTKWTHLGRWLGDWSKKWIFVKFKAAIRHLVFKASDWVFANSAIVKNYFCDHSACDAIHFFCTHSICFAACWQIFPKFFAMADPSLKWFLACWLSVFENFFFSMAECGLKIN